MNRLVQGKNSFPLISAGTVSIDKTHRHVRPRAAEQQQAICTSAAARVTPRNCRRHPIDRHLFKRKTVDDLAGVDARTRYRGRGDDG